LGSKPFKLVGRRALSKFFASDLLLLNRWLIGKTGYYLVSTLLMYTAGIKIFLLCNQSAGLSSASAKAAAFFVVLPCSILGGEIFHWAFDKPAVWLGHAVFDWTRK
jgi:hypothetical protein